jgi:tRNA-Thr(GGU) m(6)t(6)A37 methyltransferase TsaA
MFIHVLNTLLYITENQNVMTIEPVAFFHSPLCHKFGIPRQSGLVSGLKGEITFVKEWQKAEAIRGLDGFDYLWLIWGFSAHEHTTKSPTVRPPLLGGNRRMGVFATRSPFRPNNLGLSCVKLDFIEWETPNGPVLHVLGGDLMDGTPVYDIKPYLPSVEAHGDARGGFTDEAHWQRLHVEVPEEMKEQFSESQLQKLINLLELDPRPQYIDDADRIYGLMFDGRNIHFRVDGDKVYLV